MKRTFGEVEGHPEGTEYPDRLTMSQGRVHRATQAGITGGTDGAESIVLSGGYVDDEDLGDVIVYTGQGGNDTSTKA